MPSTPSCGMPGPCGLACTGQTQGRSDGLLGQNKTGCASHLSAPSPPPPAPSHGTPFRSHTWTSVAQRRQRCDACGMGVPVCPLHAPACKMAAHSRIWRRSRPKIWPVRCRHPSPAHTHPTHPTHPPTPRNEAQQPNRRPRAHKHTPQTREMRVSRALVLAAAAATLLAGPAAASSRGLLAEDMAPAPQPLAKLATASMPKSSEATPAEEEESTGAQLAAVREGGKGREREWGRGENKGGASTPPPYRPPPPPAPG